MKFSPRTHPPTGDSARRLDAAALARLLDGFDLLLCGLLIAALGILLCLVSATIDVVSWAATPLGAGLATWGAGRMAASVSRNHVMEKYAGWCVGFAVTSLALSPFLFWWRLMPKNFYFAVNVLLFAMAFTGLVFSVNWFVARLFRAAGDEHAAREASSVGWLVLVGWLLPLCAAVGFLTRASIEYSEPIGWILRKVLSEATVGFSRWTLIAMTLCPVLFTGAVLLKARARCLKLLTSPVPNSPTKQDQPVNARDEDSSTRLIQE